jgi:nucleoside-diphosphate-sugar epimerase
MAVSLVTGGAGFIGSHVVEHVTSSRQPVATVSHGWDALLQCAHIRIASRAALCKQFAFPPRH